MQTEYLYHILHQVPAGPMESIASQLPSAPTMAQGITVPIAWRRCAGTPHR
ncbi:MAG: hypothetical protein J2P37_01950 [Ktedonobacteraceae bacterium]|nr:hypothetical protein [Ktedonobacteraceae bacterium]MBO0795822.1 hypothetical protein [Ktedonobacteraceae bacterium]